MNLCSFNFDLTEPRKLPLVFIFKYLTINICLERGFIMETNMAKRELVYMRQTKMTKYTQMIQNEIITTFQEIYNVFPVD